MSEKASTLGGVSSPVVVFLLLITICFTLSLGTVENSSNHRVLCDVPQLAMIILMTAGLAVVGIFMCCPAVVKSPEQEHNDNLRHRLHSRLAVSGVVLFYVVVSVLDVSHLAADIVCWSSWGLCDDVIVSRSHHVDLAFYIIRNVFMGCEMMLCAAYHRLSFRRSPIVVHGLVVVLAANVALWFDSLISETFDQVGLDETAACLPNNLNLSTMQMHTLNETTFFNSSVMMFALRCWSKTTGEYAWLKDSDCFMFPVSIEFTLLISESMADWLFRSVPENEEDEQEVVGLALLNNGGNQNTDELRDEMNNLVSESELSCSPEEKRLQELLINNKVHAVTFSSSIPQMTVEESPHALHIRCSKVFMTVATLISIGLCVVSILVLYVSKTDESKLQEYNDAYKWYSLVYFVFMFCCTIVGFQCCRSFKRPNHRTIHLEYLLLGAVVGPLFLSMTRLTSFKNPSAGALRAVCRLREVANIIQVLTQIVFYFYAKDVSIAGMSINRRTSIKLPATFPGRNMIPVGSFSKKIAFVDVLFVLSLGNAVQWFIDSFILPLMSKRLAMADGFDVNEWKMVDTVMDPITMFFRFNSALLFLSALCYYKKKQASLTKSMSFSCT